jgi:prophage maintenance system killer protein
VKKKISTKKQKKDQSKINSLDSVIKNYARSWAILGKYDEGTLTIERSKKKEKIRLEYDFTRDSIDKLARKLRSKEDIEDLFSNERDESFKGILLEIYQSIGGKSLYPSLEEKAPHLLYFLIKDHPFSDGNKRIGAFLFVLFLELNKILCRKNGKKTIDDNTLVVLAILVAKSSPKEKDEMIALITNLIA